MSSTTSSSSSSGIGLPSLLGVTFIVLKLTHVIDWSWWWVLAPFWIGFVVWVVFMVIFLLFAGAILKNTRP